MSTNIFITSKTKSNLVYVAKINLFVTLYSYYLKLTVLNPTYNKEHIKDTLITLLVYGSARLITNHEVADLILGTSTILICGLDLERGPPNLVRTTQ